jgi:hypothetical protein
VLTGDLGFRRVGGVGAVDPGVVELLSEGEDANELRVATVSAVAQFAGRRWPRAQAISRRRSCYGR